MSGCLLGVLLCGCSSVPPSGTEPVPIPVPNSANIRMEIFRCSAAMYLKPEPCESICLELHAVEGAEPDEETVQAMVQFLRTHSQKQIVVKRKKMISADEAMGLSPQAVATLSIGGPDALEVEAPSAFVRVFFFNGSREQGAVACALSLYPCGILVNVSRLEPSERRFLPGILKHECGHVLGLCGNLGLVKK